MMKKRLQPLAEINVVPYIDVMLVLVVILMLTAPMLTQGVKVTLPHAHTKVLHTHGQPPVIISVNQAGQFFVNVNQHPQSAAPLQDVLVRVAAEHQLDPQRMILVKGDQGVAYGKVVTLMAMLQQAGIQEVGMITQPMPAR